MALITTAMTIRTLAEFDAAPLGTVVQGQFGVRVKTSMQDDGEGWTYAEKPSIERPLSPLDVYTVLYAPAVEELEADEIGDLAEVMWEIRNTALRDSGSLYYGSERFTTDDHETVYRALAEFVLTEFGEDTEPSQVLDNIGHTWTRREDGRYSIQDPEGWSTLVDIERCEGIASVIK